VVSALKLIYNLFFIMVFHVRILLKTLVVFFGVVWNLSGIAMFLMGTIFVLDPVFFMHYMHLI
jgi:hypothetical protein